MQTFFFFLNRLPLWSHLSFLSSSELHTGVSDDSIWEPPFSKCYSTEKSSTVLINDVCYLSSYLIRLSPHPGLYF